MKKYMFISAIALSSATIVTTTTQSCATVAGTSIGLSVIKNILLAGIDKGLGIFSDKNSFLGNALIEAALPNQLKEINTTLEKIGLGNLVQKEKEYIAEAAAFTVNISRPILENAVNNMTTEDAVKIAEGGRGAATQLLRAKTESQLIAAITPKVDAKLNEYGIVKTINTALNTQKLLGSLLGDSGASATSGISHLASQQMVKGLFYIIENYETTDKNNPLNILK
ncbi:MAG: DUF4197 family protein [Cloacibacterium sp.]|nr:DUF4197 family protein [Cloacibacterium sp.]